MGIIILFVAFIALVALYILAVQFPEVVTQMTSAADAIIFYIGQAMDIVWVFVPRTATLAFMGICVAVEVVYLGYQFVLWILKKVPTASIS